MKSAMGGRPSAFKPELIEEMRGLAEAGVSDCEIAARFGVSRMTLNRWGRAHPEFFEARALKRENARKPPGRPKWYRPEFAERARRLCELGYSDAEVGMLLGGFHASTVYRWCREHAEFGAAVAAGRATRSP